VLSRGILGLLLLSATTPVALQRGIYTVFFCLSAGSVKEEMRLYSWFMLREGEPSFMEFLASPAVMRLVKAN
jgi:hypothetical protein